MLEGVVGSVRAGMIVRVCYSRYSEGKLAMKSYSYSWSKSNFTTMLVVLTPIPMKLPF